ncbi:MAG: iron-containing alcohol dehydrogenase [Steroidobacteraceae bacterium]
MSLPPNSQWNYPTSVRFGIGRIAELPALCKEVGMRKPLFVTDPQVAKLPFFQDCMRSLEAVGLPFETHSDIQPNPVEDNVKAGVKLFRACNCEGVIAIGGGSALDVGKAVALMSGQRRPLWDFEDREDWWKRVDTSHIARVIAVPTTAGTGSEVGRAAVITDLRNHVKKIIFHPLMMPACVILDPALTVGLPPHVTAATGMDALSHALEAFCASGYHPMADGIAAEAMRLIADALPRAYRDGSDLEARAQMLVASSMGATAFQKGLGAMHAMSHPCSALLGSHHGLTNAVVMPYVLAWNEPVIADRLGRLAAYLGLEHASFSGVLDWVLELRGRLGIPGRVDALGVREEHIEALATQAHADPSAATNPCQLSVADFASLFRSALAGELPNSRAM